MKSDQIEIKESEDSFLSPILNKSLKEIMAAVSAANGSLFLFDSENKELVLESFYNSLDLPGIRGQKIRIGEGVSGRVADIRAPVLVKDIDSDGRFSRNGFTHYKTKSFISIPLFISDKLIGLINLADKAFSDYFSEEDLRIAVTIAKYSCQEIELLKNYSSLKAEKDQLHVQKVRLEKYASVGKLAAGVVHEVNNPLDGIVRYTNMLLSQMEENSAAREYLLEIKKGLHRIGGITKSLVEFSYQVNSEAPQRKNHVDLGLLIDECLDYCCARLNGKLKIKRHYPQELPRIMDLGVSNVFRNLIKNAVDAMPEGGLLEIAIEDKDSFLKVSFKDSGTGISEELREQIFEPFFTTKSIYQGSGLGLAICREIIDRYGGRIDLVSEVGKGSTFTVSFPEKWILNV